MERFFKTSVIMNHERNSNQNHDEGLLHVIRRATTTGENNDGTTVVRQHWVAATPKRLFFKSDIK